MWRDSKSGKREIREDAMAAVLGKNGGLTRWQQSEWKDQVWVGWVFGGSTDWIWWLKELHEMQDKGITWKKELSFCSEQLDSNIMY